MEGANVMSRWRRWAVRTIVAFLIVYALGLLGIPTLVPYITILLVMAVDGARTATTSRRARS